MPSAGRIVIVMPTYNERQNLEPIAGRVRTALPAADLLVVDDNSPDGTGDIADKLAEADPHVQVMHRTEKSGLGKAYIAGAEIAKGLGISSFLIDGVDEIQDEWFQNVETVLITAGASAPEDVVHECIEYLQNNFGATNREETVRKESVHFPLPKSLRDLLLTESVVGAGMHIDESMESDSFDDSGD